jgi:hypothetical protein
MLFRALGGKRFEAELELLGPHLGQLVEVDLIQAAVSCSGKEKRRKNDKTSTNC